MLNVKEIRKDFPILSRLIRGKPLVYLDNAATSQKPAIVLEALQRFYRESNANVHRAVYVMAEEATQAYEQARERVAKFLGAPSSKTIIFTRNATEAINLVAYTWAESNLEPGDEIIVSDLEHHSNLVPWIRLAGRKRLKLVVWESNAEGVLDIKVLRDLLSVRTRLVAITQMSNVLGTITPLEDVIEVAHRHHAVVVVDGAQGASHLGVNVGVLGCDFYVCSSHKMLGPMGIGVLYGREELLRGMEPFLGGGEMIREVHYDRVTWNDLPWKFEAGTPNVADAVGLGAAVTYLEQIGMSYIHEHEQELTTHALKRLNEMGNTVTLYGPKDAKERGGVIAFNLEGVHAHDVGTALDFEGVAVRAGHHCAQPLMRKLGVPATARASFYLYNTIAEVDHFVDSLKKVHAFFAGGARVG